MIKNMGHLDQFLRFGISLVLIYSGFIDDSIVHDSLSRWIIGGIGVASLIVALLRFCPLYTLAGVSTCPNHNKK